MADCKRGKFDIWLGICMLLLAIPSCHADVNGGTNCAACVVITALVTQTAGIYNESVIQSMERICNYMPDDFRKPCKDFAIYFGPILIALMEDGDTPDRLCHKVGICFTQPLQPACNLFPQKSNERFYHYTERPDLVAKVRDYYMPPIGAGICDLPGIKEICKWINLIFNNHEPAIDLDGDRHSPYETLRGYAWRGKDCDDDQTAVHPGARSIDSDRIVDTNCNGIKGVDAKTQQPYEETFCADSQQRGFAVLGDSISAHFHLPREWFNSSELSVANFEAAAYILENELDWPAFSYGTGFMNATDTLKHVIHGDTDSIYYRLWQRNRCNFRDYQNIAVNGARASSMVDPIQKSLYRNLTGDFPLVIVYALVGNDVCNGHPDTLAHMTTPAEFRISALETMAFLEENVPKGSYVFLTGLADGRVLYDNLKDRIHPIGSYKNDVRYVDLYSYMNCLEVSPCTGWLNTNETLRNLVTKRAEELSAVLEDIAKNHAGDYKTYKLFYNPNPINIVINEWVKSGGQAWELLEPVDGFHANQVGNAQVARVTWEMFEKNYPDVIGKLNPHNEEIHAIFGDQGGYR